MPQQRRWSASSDKPPEARSVGRIPSAPRRGRLSRALKPREAVGGGPVAANGVVTGSPGLGRGAVVAVRPWQPWLPAGSRACAGCDRCRGASTRRLSRRGHADGAVRHAGGPSSGRRQARRSPSCRRSRSGPPWCAAAEPYAHGGDVLGDPPARSARHALVVLEASRGDEPVVLEAVGLLQVVVRAVAGGDEQLVGGPGRRHGRILAQHEGVRECRHPKNALVTAHVLRFDLRWSPWRGCDPRS